VDTFPQDAGADSDLDALMMRVREAAMTGSAAIVAPPEPAAPTADPTGSDFDLMRLVEAQAEWNEHTRKAIAAVVSSLRTLRDDWADAHARMCHELEQLAALVDQLRSVDSQGTRRKAARRRVSIKRGTRRTGSVNGRRP